jgi:hypothetical protein
MAQPQRGNSCGWGMPGGNRAWTLIKFNRPSLQPGIANVRYLSAERRYASLLILTIFWLEAFCLPHRDWVASCDGPLGKEAWVSGALIVVISAAALVAFARLVQWGLRVLGFWPAVLSGSRPGGLPSRDR